MIDLDRSDFCCEDMYRHLKGDEHGCEIHFRYSPKTRDYSIAYKKEFGSGYQEVGYCPWCGSKLPPSLDDKMVEILQNEYGFDFTEKTIRDYKIPPEFKTDEWWKKRGL